MFKIQQNKRESIILLECFKDVILINDDGGGDVRWINLSLPEFSAAENDAFDKQRSRSGIVMSLRGTLRLGL